MSTDAAAPTPDRPTGRLPLSRRQAAKIARTWAVAPRMFARKADVPRKSPGLHRFYVQAPHKWHQTRGFCVGWALANLFITENTAPRYIGPRSKRQDQTLFSPLYAYGNSRRQAQEEGINLGRDDGSFVSAAIMAASKYGIVPWEMLPSYTDAQDVEGRWNNATFPASDERLASVGREHVAVAHARVESFDHALQLNAAGLAIDLGTMIGRSMFNTDPTTGRVSITGGGVAGGHSYLLLDHDRDAGTALLGNSWSGWGKRRTESAFAPMGGYDNVGLVELSEVSRILSSRALSSGESEAYAVTQWPDFQPRVRNLLI